MTCKYCDEPTSFSWWVNDDKIGVAGCALEILARSMTMLIKKRKVR